MVSDFFFAFLDLPKYISYIYGTLYIKYFTIIT